MAEKEKKGVLRSFSSTYWVVVFFEFMERGSYYGMMSVLSVYLTDILGFAKTSVGLIKGTIQPILYFLPIISGALADRFGYRRTLTIAFALLGGGYFLTSQVTSYTAVFLALCVMALGAGTFKPIISGSIARLTDKSNSTLGFGIYYWSINLGAFLFPLILVPFLKNSPAFGWRWVIIASALGTGAMIIPTLFFYKEPPRGKEEKVKDWSLLKTVANAFEIIYSPFVLIYQYLRSSRGKAVLVYAITALLLLLSLWQYGHRSPVTEKFDKVTALENGTAVTFSITRDVMKRNPFSVKKQHALQIGDYQLIFEIKPDANAPESIKPVQIDGKDIFITITKPEDENLAGTIKENLSGIVDFSPALTDSVLTQFERNSVNRIFVNIAKPDNYEEFKQDLLTQLKQNASLANLSSEIADALFEKALSKTTLTVKVGGNGGTDYFAVRQISPLETEIILRTTDAEKIDAAKILQQVRANPNFATVSFSDLSGLIANAQQRSFFTFFIVLLFVSSLIILAIQKRYREAAPSKRLIYNFLASAFIVALLWLLPGLDTFGRIVSTVIYFTVLSLFTIETDDKEKFKDNFRFLLMIFIYSGFWILYFQMFDSVLWYVKAYVDATSLNNFVNSALAKIGVHINWFFDVEHVTVINAGTIILLQLIVSNIVKNTKALPTMVAGIAMGTIGMAILAISTSIWVFVAGIIIFSIGEMTAHPKFISYVGLTAPKDRVATYMGYIFLYGVIGSSIGAILGANLYVHFVDKLNQPRTLWLIFSGIGVATIVALLLYNKFVPQKSDA